jgi:hypothetical protein
VLLAWYFDVALDKGKRHMYWLITNIIMEGMGAMGASRRKTYGMFTFQPKNFRALERA